MTNKVFDQINNKINSANNIAILSHIRPDGDTLGSSLALKSFLTDIKNCTVFCDDVIPTKYDFLKDSSKIKQDGLSSDYDLVICVDSSDVNRLGSFADFVKKHKNTINIDHHISNEKYADINYVVNSSSTCEIIFDFLRYVNATITNDIAECIYCGLSSDTGNFSHSNTNFESFINASELVKVLGDVSYINQKIYKEMSISRLKLLSLVTSKIQLHLDDKLAILYVLKNDLAKLNCDSFETEGLVDYAINLKGVEVGMILLESDDNSYKISLRSKNVDVCKIAKDFGGGGHIHAAGCMLYGDLDSVIKKLIKTTEFYVG